MHSTIPKVLRASKRQLSITPSAKQLDKTIAGDENITPHKKLSLTSPAASTLDTRMSVEILDTPIKSESDKKSYRIIKLANGLRALLISDPVPAGGDVDSVVNSDENLRSVDENSLSGDESSSGSDSGSDEDELLNNNKRDKQSACSICVDVGSFSDPRDIQGLAHFLEHMIFMGSRKYPRENEFDDYLQKGGGFMNADTDCEETNFYFEVLDHYLDGAVDRFSNLLKEPLLLREAMTREREAVESEFTSKMFDDDVRREQLLASIGRNEHPASIFPWGNLKTLKELVDDDTLYEKVREFRERHYSANRMYLCVQAQRSLDNLQKLIVDNFTDVPNNRLEGDSFSQFNSLNAFTDDFSNKVFFIRPIANISRIDITWCLSSFLKEYRCKAHHYIAQQLGYGGKGSLNAYLQRKFWITNLVANVDESGFDSNSMYSFFTISANLTKSGFDHITEILSAIFSYINFFTRMGEHELLYNEIKSIDHTEFRFKLEKDPLDNVEDTVINLKYYTPKDTLTGPHLYYEYNEKLIVDLLKALNENNFNIMITSPYTYESVQYDQKEKWFGTEYGTIDYPDKWKRSLIVKDYSEFQLPTPNEYIATDFSLCSNNLTDKLGKYPRKIFDNEICELWFRRDDTFLLPHSLYYLYIMTPVAMEDAKSHVMLSIYTMLLKFELTETLFPATVASLDYSVYPGDRGIILQVNGYSEKSHIIVEVFINCLRSFMESVHQEMFDMMVEQLSKSYHNALIQPKNLGKSLRLNVLEVKHFNLIEKYTVLKTIKLSDIKTFSQCVLRQIKIKALVQGNLLENQAIDVMTSILRILNSQKIEDPNKLIEPVRQIPIGNHYIRCRSLNPNNVNTVVTNYYQIGPISILRSCMLDLLISVIEEPLFDVLRSKEQLAYNVSCSVRDSHGILSYIISIHSQENKFTAEYVDERIEVFQRQYFLDKLNESNFSVEFNEIRNALIKRKMIGLTSLKDEVNRNWAEITTDEYCFNRLELEADCLQHITLEQFIEFYRNECLSDKIKKKLSIQVIGDKLGNLAGTDISMEDDEYDSKEILNDDVNINTELKWVDLPDKSSSTCIRDLDTFKNGLQLYAIAKTCPV